MEDLSELKREIPYKWRRQSINSKNATYIAYIDSRDVQDLLDSVIGAMNWKVEFRQEDRKTIHKIYENGLIKETIPVVQTITICKISIYDEDKKEWVSKEDVGEHSQFSEIYHKKDYETQEIIDDEQEDNNKEKTDFSDALKRSAVLWGIGRFLYRLENIILETTKTDKYGYKPVDDCGNILWNTKDENYVCNEKIKGNPKVDIKKHNFETNNKYEGKTITFEKKEQEKQDKSQIKQETPKQNTSTDVVYIITDNHNSFKLKDDWKANFQARFNMDLKLWYITADKKDAFKEKYGEICYLEDKKIDDWSNEDLLIHFKKLIMINNELDSSFKEHLKTDKDFVGMFVAHMFQTLKPENMDRNILVETITDLKANKKSMITHIQEFKGKEK